MTLERWMTPDPQVLGPGDSALEALERMAEWEVRHLPVLNEKGGVIGVVSIDDLRAALPFDVGADTPLQDSARAVAQQYRVGEVMTYLPVTARPDTSLEDGVRQLLERHIGCLPICDGSGKLVAIFSESDALRALLELLARERGVSAARPRGRGERASELDHLVERLQLERQWIARELERSDGLQGPVVGDPVREDEPAEEIGRLAAARLRQIDAALERHRRGELGRCARCERTIPLGRLQALPSAEHCVRCARVEESKRPGARSEPEASVGSKRPGARSEPEASVGRSQRDV
jgi:CBS domain-containing protein